MLGKVWSELKSLGGSSAGTRPGPARPGGVALGPLASAERVGSRACCYPLPPVGLCLP